MNEKDTIVKNATDRYRKICGDYGIETFATKFVPRAIMVYPDPADLERALDDAIEHAGDQKPSEVSNFLNNAIVKTPKDYQFKPDAAISQIETWIEQGKDYPDSYGCRGIGIETFLKYIKLGGVIPHYESPYQTRTWLVEFSPFSYNIKKIPCMDKKHWIVSTSNLNEEETQKVLINSKENYAKYNAVIDYLWSKGFRLKTEFDHLGFPSDDDDFDEFYSFLKDHKDNSGVWIRNPTQTALDQAKHLGLNPEDFKRIYSDAIKRQGIDILFNKKITEYPLAFDGDIGSIVIGNENIVLPLDVIHGVIIHSQKEKQELINTLMKL